MPRAQVSHAAMRSITLALVAALASTSAARAEAIVIPQDVASSFPFADLALPTNARPIFFGTLVDDITFVRVDADGDTTLVHQTVASAFGSAAYLVEVGALDGLTELTVATRCPTCSFLATWPVGDAPDESAPVFADGPAELTATGHTGGSFNPFIAGYDMDGRLPRVDDDGPLVIRLRGDVELVDSTQLTDDSAPVISFQVDGGDARTLCMTASAIDAAGNETDLPDPLCADLDPSVNDGCTQTSGAPFAFALIALVVTRRRSAR